MIKINGLEKNAEAKEATKSWDILQPEEEKATEVEKKSEDDEDQKAEASQTIVTDGDDRKEVDDIEDALKEASKSSNGKTVLDKRLS